MIKDYYKTLGGKFDENFVHLRLRYIKKVMPVHPQNDNSKIEEFHNLNEAFYVISHIDYRNEYNKFYRQEIIGENLGIDKSFMKKRIEKWISKSAKRSNKAKRMSSTEFFQSIPEIEKEKDKSIGLLLINFLLDLGISFKS